MNVSVWRGLLALIMLPGAAQLVLPEFYLEEEPGMSPEKAGAEGQGPEERMAFEQQMRQMMQALQGRRPPGGLLEPLVEAEDAFPSQEFQQGPEELVLELMRADGRSVRLAVPNQTVRVQTRVGPMPLRLHEVEEIRREADAMIFRFRDGDQVSGQLARLYLPVPEQSGHFRALMLEGISLIRLSVPE